VEENQSKLRILALGSRYSGVTYHRLAMPLSIMAKEYCLITDVFSEELLIEKNINVVIVNRFIENYSLYDLLALKTKHGFKLVVDIDDYWELFDQHLSAVGYRKHRVASVIKNYIKNADLVTCTHSRLWAEIIKINKNCEILPNGLPFDKDQFTTVQIPHETINIIHTGSITHYPDIKQLKHPMRELAKSKAFRESTKMILCGWNDFNKWHWQQMADIYTADKKLNHEILHSMNVELYMNFYNEADMLVVPMLDNKFNRMKSNLKALEAGAKRIPILAFNRDPYADIPTIFQVDNWEQDIKRMIFSKQMREDYGQRNGDYVREHYDIFKINEARNAIYNRLIQ
jgi:hypothetical protein